MDTSRVLSAPEIVKACSGWVGDAPLANVKKEEVPLSLHSLIPYAEIWGIADDWEREKRFQRTPQYLVENLKWVVSEYEEELDTWLAGPEASSKDPSDSYVTFSAMRMGVDFI